LEPPTGLFIHYRCPGGHPQLTRQHKLNYCDGNGRSDSPSALPLTDGLSASVRHCAHVGQEPARSPELRACPTWFSTKSPIKSVWGPSPSSRRRLCSCRRVHSSAPFDGSTPVTCRWFAHTSVHIRTSVRVSVSVGFAPRAVHHCTLLPLHFQPLQGAFQVTHAPHVCTFPVPVSVSLHASRNHDV